MSQQFLLPCECGNQLVVTPAQAGRRIDCDCGRVVAVPTLGGLRQLAPVKESTPEARRPVAWNAWRGMLFVGGVLLAILGLVIGGYASNIVRQIDVARVAEYVEGQELADIDEIEKMSPAATYELWKNIKNLELGRPGYAPQLRAQAAVNRYFTWAAVGFGIAALGLAMSAFSLVKT